MSVATQVVASPLRAMAATLVTAGFVATRTIDGVRRVGGLMFARASGSLLSLMPRTKYDYARDVDAARNSIVVAAIGWMARNFPDAPIRISRTVGTTVEIVQPGKTGPGAMLRLLERPNPSYSGPLMLNAAVWDYKLTGDCYIWKVRGGGQGSDRGRPEQLWWLPSWMVEPRWPVDDTSVFISYYEYRVDGGVWAIPPEDIIHIRNGINPHNTRKGRSPMASLFREIFTDDEAANLTASLMRNFGVPGLIVAPANTTTGPGISNAAKVQQDLVDKFGSDGSGQPMVMTKPTEVRVLSWSPQQMDLKAIRRLPEERTTAVLGIPAIVAGLGAGLDRSTFSNFGEARAAAYTESVIPDQRVFAAELEVHLLDDFADLEDGWDVSFDYMKASAMQALADAVWTRHESAATKGLITRADFKAAVGKPVAANRGDEVYVFTGKTNFIPADEKPPTALVMPTTAPSPS